MSMAEWEAPIPMWIDSINIDMDEELPASDFMVNIPVNPCTPKTHSFTSCSTPVDEQHFLFNNLLEDKPVEIILDIKDVKVVETPIKTKCTTAPSLSPVKRKSKTKPTAKPARQPRHKVHVDPSGSNQRRKDKQRGYERGYRGRKKTKSSSDKVEWIQLETQVRKMLAKRTSVVVLGALSDLKTEFNPSTVWIRQRYLELLQEERALLESNALDSCLLAEAQANALWGGGNAASRDLRAQVNGLPSLRTCHTFEFSW